MNCIEEITKKYNDEIDRIVLEANQNIENIVNDANKSIDRIFFKGLIVIAFLFTIQFFLIWRAL